MSRLYKWQSLAVSWASQLPHWHAPSPALFTPRWMWPVTCSLSVMIPRGKRLWLVHRASQKPQFRSSKPAFCVLLLLVGLSIAFRILYKLQELQIKLAMTGSAKQMPWCMSTVNVTLATHLRRMLKARMGHQEKPQCQGMAGKVTSQEEAGNRAACCKSVCWRMSGLPYTTNF